METRSILWAIFVSLCLCGLFSFMPGTTEWPERQPEWLDGGFHYQLE
jgi:hypothetical protein